MSTDHKEQGNADEKQKMDEVLRRMLSTPPPKPEPKQQEKKTG